MYKYKTINLSLIVSLTLLTGCVNSAIGSLTKNISSVLTDNNASSEKSKGGDNTIAEAMGLSAVIAGGITYWRTGSVKKAFAGAVAGGIAGYLIGKKLASMQKDYKGKEEKLLSKIIKIEEESIVLEKKNIELTSNLSSIEDKIINLEKEKLEKGENTVQLKKVLTAELESKKQNLETLLMKNKQISRNIASSKSQINEYDYDAEDKKDILEMTNILSDNSKKYEKDLNTKLASIDTMMRNLA